MSQDVQTNTETYVYSNGGLILYREGEVWRYQLVIAGEPCDKSEDTYVTKQAAKQNGRSAFRVLVGEELRY